MGKSRKDLSRRDGVSWQRHGHDKQIEAADRTVDASEEEPLYEVQKDETGKQADHRPESMSRTDGGGS